MAELKILGKTIDEWKESSFPSRLAAAKAKSKQGELGNRVDFSDEKIGPKFKADKKPIKITKKETSVETPTGDIGSVDRTEDVIGPDMSKVNKSAPEEKWMDPHEQARRSLGFKKGGKVKAKSYCRGGGIEVRGKTKGRMV